MDHIVKDLSWLEKFGGSSGLMQLELSQDSRGKDLAEEGKRISFTLRLMNLPLSCELVNVKYKPDKKFWLLVITEMDGWLCMRFDLDPVPEGCRVTLDAIGYPPLGFFIGATAHQIFKAVSQRLDIMLAIIQSQFDRTVDPDMLRDHGLRGKIVNVLFQSNQVQVWINESPDLVSKWCAKSENFEKILAPESSWVIHTI